MVLRLRYRNRWVKGLFFCCCFVSLMCLVSCFQVARYRVDSYNCVGMSRDCAGFFVRLGIPTELVHGYIVGDDSSHCWVRLWGWLGFESTLLLPDVFGLNNRYRVYDVEKLN